MEKQVFKNIDIAVGTTLLYCVQAEISVLIFYESPSWISDFRPWKHGHGHWNYVAI